MQKLLCQLLQKFRQFLVLKLKNKIHYVWMQKRTQIPYFIVVLIHFFLMVGDGESLGLIHADFFQVSIQEVKHKTKNGLL